MNPDKANSPRIVTIDVLRYRPEQESTPTWQSYEVPCCEEWTVLDALNHIKDHLDGSLSYRWSCHMAVCGSCGMMINGNPTLSCKAFMRDLPDQIKVEPLANLGVIRDLVVQQNRLVDGMAAVKSWLIPRELPPRDDQYRQTPAQLAKYRPLSMCINCMLCYAACPQVALNEGYLGPAALALAQDDGVWECTFIGECSEVCPKHVDPAGAIQQMKLASSLQWLARRIPGGGS
ncbi:MAG: succinate dehydrogenase/fumarate reductase iron-sulfur subunit [Gammaproteobacteria bacterium HGW-Gammaproteobacteria-2]|nr:MAG: succinate dehydrogenase/fumarate reductase iron-sulfur subunit [Gammaproteobacteria bacterium HGW-Gammaproteobacteria-2]